MASQAALSIASHSFHKPNALCVVCALNALTETYYVLIDSQAEIDDQRHLMQDKKLTDDDAALKIIDSSCGSSMHYLLTNLQDTELSEFEAYISIGRNLIEKVSRIIDIISDEKLKKQASVDFQNTTEDIKLLFESSKPSTTALMLKKAKWLGRGTDRSNIDEDEYGLLYAYLSRVIHVSNMDTLLHPKEDRFFVKAYVLIKTAKLYHKYMVELKYLTDESIKLHKKCCTELETGWKSKGVSPENLIYSTTYYDDSRGVIEARTLSSYKKKLQNAFSVYNEHGAHVLPKFDIVETGAENDKPN